MLNKQRVLMTYILCFRSESKDKGYLQGVCCCGFGVGLSIEISLVDFSKIDFLGMVEV